ncbi:hypothetical protein J6590_057301 [Homalodisca vitripennis]|nr:hypothetical protein J6590_057301 [Homalodisca vitripennis]
MFPLSFLRIWRLLCLLFHSNILPTGRSKTTYPKSEDNKSHSQTGTLTTDVAITSPPKDANVATTMTKTSTALSSQVHSGTIPKVLPVTTESLASGNQTTIRVSSEKVGWIYNLKKPELIEEISKYGLPIEGNSEDLRSRFVTLRSQGLVRTLSTYSKSLDNTLLSADNTDVQGTSTIPAVSTLNTRMEDSSQLELASFREILGLSPSASAETVKRVLVNLKNMSSSETNHIQQEPLQPASQSPYTLLNPNTAVTYLAPRDPIFTTTVPIDSGVQSNELRDTAPISAKNSAHICNIVRKWNLHYEGNGDPVSFLERLNELTLQLLFIKILMTTTHS